ncbi:Maf family protein [Merismopedia glauca]|uniref:Nucleoside triphosphate pyrophosphatase n=1 Tax=Merismopedia glauca CCAP 1448/3 TaxID=1296344 RepID=A0A2T1C3D2_9CYAN|nr:nucleoside triphosphate pyrophosphatase [Merismopedia glauca]PSB02714.1 septum formation inhibitor Maf [Merismopedia glauca CCAP 1448/3]
MNNPQFVLASASPARRRLLESVGINAKILVSDFDESLIQKQEPIDLVQTLAQCKAEKVAQQCEDSLILGCDSVLSLGGEIYGKPDSPAQAIARWQKMRSQVGILYTGHALIDRRQARQVVKCGITRVHFADLTDTQIKAYVKTEEPLKCAGCFAIEGRGGLFVERLEGCHTNVIGLSLPLLRQMLAELGYDVTNFWD